MIDSVAPRDAPQRFARREPRADLWRVLCAKHRAPIACPARGAPTSYAVPNIIGVRSAEHVARVAAGRIVAGVPDHVSSAQIALRREEERDAVGDVRFPVAFYAELQLAVAVGVAIARPRPAGVLGPDGYPGPEPRRELLYDRVLHGGGGENRTPVSRSCQPSPTSVALRGRCFCCGSERSHAPLPEPPSGAPAPVVSPCRLLEPLAGRTGGAEAPPGPATPLRAAGPPRRCRWRVNRDRLFTGTADQPRLALLRSDPLDRSQFAPKTRRAQHDTTPVIRAQREPTASASYCGWFTFTSFQKSRDA